MNSGHGKSIIGLICALAIIFALPLVAKAQSASDYAGKFKGDKVSIECVSAGDGIFAGTIYFGAKQFSFKAHVENSQLVGTFNSGGNEYPFTALLSGGNLTFSSGGGTYGLDRVEADAPPGNPLSPGSGPPQAGAPGDSGGGEPAGGGATFGSFSVLGTTATGKTLYLKLPAGQTLEAAIIHTAEELGKVLDGKPALTQAFATAQNKNKGGASLTGKLQGHDMKGVIFCSAEANGGSSIVIIDAPDASKGDVAALFGFIPVPLKMTTHSFPDGSGSVDLPDGWTTITQSASNGIFVKGPAGEMVLWCFIQEIFDPNCRGQKLRRQIYEQKMWLYRNAVQNYNHMVQIHNQYPGTIAPGDPPKPPEAWEPDPNIESIKEKMPMRYCTYCDGIEGLIKVYSPTMASADQRAGLPYTVIDKVIVALPGSADPAHPNVNSGTIYLAASTHDGEKLTRMRQLNKFWTCNVMLGESWQLTGCYMIASDETFDKDLPVMSAIMNSVKVDNGVVSKEIAAQGEAVREQGRAAFEAMQRNHAAWEDQQARQFADHEQQIAAQEQATHESSSDFIEYIRGVRDVYDTKTGEMVSVNLFYSDAITDSLNAGANDPNRYVQIPLRYER